MSNGIIHLYTCIYLYLSCVSGAVKCRRRPVRACSSVPGRPRGCRVQEDDGAQAGSAQIRRPQDASLSAERRRHPARRDAVPPSAAAASSRSERGSGHQRGGRQPSNPDVVHAGSRLHRRRCARGTRRKNAFHLCRIRRRDRTVRLTGAEMHDGIFHFEIFRKLHEIFEIFQDPALKYFTKQLSVSIVK